MLPHIDPSGNAHVWEVLRMWSFDPLALLIVLVPGSLYARGLRECRSRAIFFPRWRPYFFYSGLGVVALALISPLDGLAGDFFLMHMLQHLALQMIGPPLVLLGAPTTPVLLGLSLPLRQKLVRPVVANWAVRHAYNWATFPPVTWGLFAGNMWAWHLFPGAYDAALASGPLHLFQHLTFAGTGLLLWWSIIDPKPLRARLPHPFRALLILVIIFQNVALGASLTFRKSLLYSHYAGSGGTYGAGALGDQQAGGALMWVGGDTLMTIALVATLAAWFDQHEKRSRQREQALDQATRLAPRRGM